jgi:hypothetical protein
MFAVALAALVFAVATWRRGHTDHLRVAALWDEARGRHLRLAESHQRIAALYRKYLAEHRGSDRFNEEQARLFVRAAGVEREAGARAARRAEGYRRAARYPWLGLPYDGREPK